MMLLAYKTKDRAVFFYAFAKNERDNIEPDELLTAREIAAQWIAAGAKVLRSFCRGSSSTPASQWPRQWLKLLLYGHSACKPRWSDI
jgi:hypothetical protein